MNTLLLSSTSRDDQNHISDRQIVLFCLKDPFRIEWKSSNELILHCFTQWIGDINSISHLNHFLANHCSFKSSILRAMNECQIENDNTYLGSFYLEVEEAKISLIYSAEWQINQELESESRILKVKLLGDQKRIVIGKKYRNVVRQRNSIRENDLVQNLTNREIEILKELLKGDSVKKVADSLYLSTHTIDSHKQNIFKKLGAKTLPELGMTAHKLGII